jgi:hypothetical protein
MDSGSAGRLARELEVSPLVARLLVQREIEQSAAAQAFLHPSLGQLHAPELMAGTRPLTNAPTDPCGGCQTTGPTIATNLLLVPKTYPPRSTKG